VTHTLVADGVSDVVLLPVLTWSLERQGVQSIVEQWADCRRVLRPKTLEARLRTALDLYPCDLLFVHRDAEAQDPDLRRQEIAGALDWTTINHVPVVPVRMTVTWLLADESPIRSAAGNPNGRINLNLPNPRTLEQVADPKEALFGALKVASRPGAHRRSRLGVFERIRRIPSYIDDYSALDALAAFRRLQDDVRLAIEHLARN